MYGLKLVTA